MLIEELIEKAFSDGYEYALMEQREFAGNTKVLNKFKKSAYEIKRGLELNNSNLALRPESSFRRDLLRRTNPDEIAHVAKNKARMHNRTFEKLGNIHDKINKRGNLGNVTYGGTGYK